MITSPALLIATSSKCADQRPSAGSPPRSPDLAELEFSTEDTNAYNVWVHESMMQPPAPPQQHHHQQLQHRLVKQCGFTKPSTSLECGKSR